MGANEDKPGFGSERSVRKRTANGTPPARVNARAGLPSERGCRYGYAMHPKIREFLLYTGVNLSATIVDYTIFLTLTHVFGWPIVQSAISYTITTFLNYGMTRTFVFRHGLSPKREHRRLLEYLATNLIGLLITAVVIWVTVHHMGLKPFAGKTISVLTCFVSLYYVRTRVVFGKDTAAA